MIQVLSPSFGNQTLVIRHWSPETSTPDTRNWYRKTRRPLTIQTTTLLWLQCY